MSCDDSLLWTCRLHLGTRWHIVVIERYHVVELGGMVVGMLLLLLVCLLLGD